MNSLFRREPANTDGTKRDKTNQRERISFDARKILDKFRDFDFGCITLNQIDFSIRYTTNKNTGFYDYVTKIKL